MKTTHKILSVLMMVVIVAALWVAVAPTPASAAALVGVTVVPSNTTQSAGSSTTAVNYTVNFTTPTGVGIGGTATIVLTGGATMTLAAAGVVPMANITVNGTACTVNGAWTAATKTLVVTSPVVVGAGGAAAVVVNSTATDYITNPVAGSYTATVTTSTGDGPTASAAYYIIGGTYTVAYTASPTTAGATAVQAVSFKTPSGLTKGTDTVTVTFPTGVVLPASMERSAVTVKIAANAAFSPATTEAAPLVSGQSVTVLIPVASTANAVAGDTIVVTISQLAGVKNPSLPSSSYYAYASTSIDTTPTRAAAATAFTPVVSFSPVSGAVGTALTVTGVGFTPGTSINLSGGATQAAPGTVNADGTFSMTGFAAGAAAVTATDGAGVTATSATAFASLATVSVSPTSGNKGSLVTVNISGLTAGNTYVLSFGKSTGTAAANILSVAAGNASVGTVAVPGITASLENGVVATAGGLITCLVTIPNTAANGSNIIYVKGGAGAFANYAAFDAAAIAGSATFTVNGPAIVISPASGPVGTQVTITGSNFPANLPATVGGGLTAMFDPTSIASTMGITAGFATDASGTFSVTGTIPASNLAGTIFTGYKLYGVVVLLGGATLMAQGAFTVTPGVVTVSPTSGRRGSSLVVMANGLTASSTVAAGNVKLNNAAWAGAPTTTAVDSSGNLTPITLTVPVAATIGANTVTLTDSAAAPKTASGTFTVTQPTITLTPATGPRGQPITITGAGWLPGALGIVQIQMPSGTTVGTAVPDGNGAFTATITVPVTFAAGSVQSVRATDSYGNVSLIQNFTVSAASISVAPTSAAVGSQVAVTGVGFQPYTGVTTITIGGVQVLGNVAVVTDAMGAFTATVSVPGVAVGGQALVAVVGGVNGSTSLTVTAAPVTPPTVTAALAPISGKFDQVWTLDAGTWKVYDPSDVANAEFNSLTPGMAIFVKATEAVSGVTVCGASHNLVAGWNLIGVVS